MPRGSAQGHLTASLISLHKIACCSVALCLAGHVLYEPTGLLCAHASASAGTIWQM